MSQAGILSESSSAAADIETITGNSGGAVGPSAGFNVNLVGSGSISVAGNPGTNTLTISISGSGFTWNTVVGTSQNIAVQNGYINANAGLTTFTLPATGSVGESFQIAGYGAGGWAIAQNAGQKVYLGNSTTTVGVPGSLASTNAHDTIEIMCIVANTEWQCLDVVGNITVV